MHNSHHERVRHHHVDHTTEDHPTREEHRLSPRDVALPALVVEQAKQVCVVYSVDIVNFLK